MSRVSDELWTIGDLAERAGVTPRTIRFYVTEGLLPPPEGSGPVRYYRPKHLTRLEAIRRLKEAYLPLHEIKQRLESLTPEELATIARSPDPRPANSALDYLQGVLAGQLAPRTSESPVVQRGPAPAPAVPTPAARSPATLSGSSDWRRIPLALGIELHVQRSGSPTTDALRDQLIREIAALVAARQG